MATGPSSASELRTCLCGTIVSGRKAVASSSASPSSSNPPGPEVGIRNPPGPSVASSSSSSASASSSASIAIAPSSSQPNVSSQKCRICRTKPKFLRGQRSLDLSTNSSPLASKRPEGAASVSNISSDASPLSPLENGISTNSGSQTPTSVISRPISQQPQRPAPTLRERRRARSAERYDGIRITRVDRGTSAIPRQSSAQPISGTNSSSGGSSGIRRPDQPPEYSSTEPLSLPLLNAYNSIPPPTHSPPPSYEAAMNKSLLPPSYDEYLAQKMQGLGGIGSSGSGSSTMTVGPSNGGQPYSWRQCDHNAGTIMPPPPFPATTPSRFPQQNVSRAVASSYEPNQGQQGQHCCTCSKCKTRYGYYDDNSGNDVLFTLETQTAMQGILTDGVALCCMM